MTLALICGAGIGIALLLVGLAIAPPRTDLAAAVGQWESQRQHKHGSTTADVADIRARMGTYLVRELRQRGVLMVKMRADLELVGKSLEEHLTRKVMLGVLGLIAPALMAGVLVLVDVRPSLAIPAFVGLVLAVFFFWVPDLTLAQDARNCRDDLRRALSCYLDLVSMSLAGGRGVPEALPTAAAIGRGWAFELIAETISRARYTSTTPWQAFSDLGERIDLPELRDLGGALSLVADDGAKVRQSLEARATTQRRRQLAEAEGDAEQGDQAIGIAQIVLGVGFMLFLGYPAVVNVLNI